MLINPEELLDRLEEDGIIEKEKIDYIFGVIKDIESGYLDDMFGHYMEGGDDYG